MKKLILCLLISVNLFSQQLEIPYLETFEDNSFYLSNNIEMIGLASENAPNGVDDNNPIEQVITEAHTYSWELKDTHSVANTNALKLTVHPEDHPQSAICPRDRAEITSFTNNTNGGSLYYSWKLFIPLDNEFEEEDTFDPNDLPIPCPDNGFAPYHIMSQFLAASAYDENGQKVFETRKLFSMNYNHDTTLGTNTKRKLSFRLYNGQTHNQLYANVIIDNALQKGIWNEIIYKVNWSENTVAENPNDYGYIQMWINRKPVVAFNTFTYTDSNNIVVNNYECNITNNSFFIPTKCEFPNQASYINSNGNEVFTNNILKLGSYRSKHVKDHSTYIDNLRITSELPPQESKTNLLPEYCNSTLDLDEDYINCYRVPDATNYTFEFKDLSSGAINYVGSTDISLYLPWVNFLEPDKQYRVRVRAKREINGSVIFNYNYSKGCNITIPHLTKLTDEFCETEVYKNENIECHEITGATNYVFEFTDINSGAVNYVGSNNTILNLSWVSFVQPGETYNVRVRARRVVNGIEEFSFNYGEICELEITAPPTPPLGKSQESSLSKNSKPHLNPNPFNSILEISNIEESTLVQIYDFTNTLVLEKSIEKDAKLEVGQLKKGIYIVTLTTKSDSFIEKLMKN